MPSAVVTAEWVADTTEGSGTPGRVRLTRSDTTGSLSVSYSVSGTATTGSDYYYVVPSYAYFAGGVGSVDLTVTATDDSASEPTETVVITLASGTGYTVGAQNSATAYLYDNDTPVAVDDVFEGDEDGEVNGDVLANDTDPNSSSMTVALVDVPSFGTLDLNSDGTFEYTPDADFYGMDVFTYAVSDGGTGNSVGVATITINPVDDDAPVIANQEFDVYEHMPEDFSVGFVLASDPDAGQTLNFAITGGNSAGVFSINSETGALLIADPDGLDFETASQFVLTVTVTDDGVTPLSAYASITVNLVNLAEGAEEDEADRIVYLNEFYDRMWMLLYGGTGYPNDDDEFAGLAPANGGPTTAVLNHLADLDNAAAGMMFAIGLDDPEAFVDYAYQYSTAMPNLGAALNDLYKASFEMIGAAYGAAFYSEGDMLRLEGIGALLSVLDNYLGWVEAELDSARSDMTWLINNSPWGGPPGGTAAIENYDLSINRIDALREGWMPDYFDFAPLPQDPQDPPLTGVNPGIDRVADMNAIAIDIEARLGTLNTQLSTAFSITAALNVWGEEMALYQDDGNEPDRTDYYAALDNYIGVNGLLALSGYVTPYGNVAPEDSNPADGVYDNYGVIGAIFDETEAFRDTIDDAIEELADIFEDHEVVDQFRTQGVDSLLAALQEQLSSLFDAIDGLLDQMSTLLAAMNPGTPLVMFPNDEDFHIFSIYPFVLLGDDPDGDEDLFYGISDYLLMIETRRENLPLE